MEKIPSKNPTVMIFCEKDRYDNFYTKIIRVIAGRINKTMDIKVCDSFQNLEIAENDLRESLVDLLVVDTELAESTEDSVPFDYSDRILEQLNNKNLIEPQNVLVFGKDREPITLKKGQQVINLNVFTHKQAMKLIFEKFIPEKNDSKNFSLLRFLSSFLQ